MAQKKKQSTKLDSKTVLTIIVVIAIIVFAYFYKDKVSDTETYLDVSGNFAVHFIDVGQGDSILIQTPDNQFMLIDTSEPTQYNKLTGYLDNFKVKEFKYVIFTHPDADHIGSADKIVKNYNIETLIMPSATSTSQTFERLVTQIENKNLEITPPVPGEHFKFGEAEFVILGPNSETYDNSNNYSVVIKMIYGKTSFVFTGDAESLSENEIISFCSKNNIDLKSDVLKVGHHGSSTSSSKKFLNALKPSIAVISCAKGNPYGHPHAETLSRLEAVGAEILRTDLQGDIVVISDGTKLSVKTSKENAT